MADTFVISRVHNVHLNLPAEARSVGCWTFQAPYLFLIPFTLLLSIIQDYWLLYLTIDKIFVLHLVRCLHTPMHYIYIVILGVAILPVPTLIEFSTNELIKMQLRHISWHNAFAFSVQSCFIPCIFTSYFTVCILSLAS